MDISGAEDYIADDNGEVIDDDARRLKYREQLLNEIKHLIKKILESEIEVMVMASLAIIGLFASDFRTMFVDKKYDIVFIVLYIFFPIGWLLEIIFSIIILNEYLFSFFFWLFSIVTLLTEIESITEKIVYLLIEEAPQEKEDSTLTPKINTIVRLIKIIRLI